MRAGNKTLMKSVLGAIALLATALLLLSVINWNFAKPWISERVSQATERHFAINGDLVLHWRWPGKFQSGWHRLVPWPHLRGHDLVLGNPAWASTGPTMARVPQIDFNLNPLQLFQKTISVSSLILSEPNLVLEVGEAGQNNWTFGEKRSEAQWKLVLQDLFLNDGTVRFVDPVKKADVTARLNTLSDQSVTWTVSGAFDGDAVSGDGAAGALLSLRDSGNVFPVKAQLKVGQTEIMANGTLTNPRRPSALDVNLSLRGASMAQLFPLSGIVLPATPRFSTEGRLVGSMKPDDFHLRYEKFEGKVGSSDIGGTLEYLRGEERPMLRGEVVSNTLNLQDLAALLGTDSEQSKKKRGDRSTQPPGKVLPAGLFRNERWDAIDAQVQFTARKIVRSEDLPIENLFAGITLDQGTLALAPLNFGVAGGKFSTDLRIDGRRDPATARMRITARGLKLNQLFPDVVPMQASLGEMHVNAQLSGAGNSIAALAASANGEVKAFISDGTISKFILEAMGLNIGSVIMTRLFGDHQVELNCLAGDFSVTDGLMQTRTFIVDTDDAIIGIEGQVSLAREELALAIHPESKGVRLFSLRSPLYVTGSFKNPEVGVDKRAVGLKAGAAVALGALASPLAALLALINPGPDEESPCPGLLAQAQKKPVAPAPGKAR